MEILLYILVIATVSVFVLLLHDVLFGQRETVLGRLGEVQETFRTVDEESELQLPFSERVIRPAYSKFVNFIGNIAPKGMNDNLSKTIAYAGNPGSLNVNRLIAIMLMTATIFGLLSFLALGISSTNSPFVIIVFTFLGLLIPLYVIHSMARNRQATIRKKLPDMLDLIYVSVEAGLGFDMAIQRTTEKMPGPLSDEFRRALDEIKKGRKRDEALRAIAHRTGVDDISTFISAIIQAEQLGSNIANMLRIQSSTMRQKRRQRTEEQAMKISIKMLFPLVFFMLPALFIVVLGPAIIRIISTFTGA